MFLSNAILKNMRRKISQKLLNIFKITLRGQFWPTIDWWTRYILNYTCLSRRTLTLEARLGPVLIGPCFDFNGYWPMKSRDSLGLWRQIFTRPASIISDIWFWIDFLLSIQSVKSIIFTTVIKFQQKHIRHRLLSDFFDNLGFLIRTDKRR